MLVKLQKALARGPRRPPAPDHEIFAVGDIHGCLDLFLALLNEILDAVATRRPELIFLGDYIDRGPNTRELVDCLLRCEINEFFRPVFLKGNHEATLLEFLQNPAIGPSWIQYGGAETLLSYGVRPPSYKTDAEGWAQASQKLAKALPVTHLKFFQSLELFAERGCYFFVHAGVDPGRRLEDQGETEFLWIREPFLEDARVLPRLIVHGHTPASEPYRDDRRVGLDLGGYQSGRIAGARFYKGEISILTC